MSAKAGAHSVIRRATPADIPALRTIYNEAVAERIATADLEPKSLEERRAWFAQFSDAFPLFVLERASGAAAAVLAYGGIAPYSTRDGYRHTGEILVYVAGAARSQGLGRRVLEHVLAAAPAAGIRYLHARIFAHNEPSLKLHRALGFRDAGRLTRAACLDFAAGNWVDVVLLELHP